MWATKYRPISEIEYAALQTEGRYSSQKHVCKIFYFKINVNKPTQKSNKTPQFQGQLNSGNKI